MGAGVVRGLAEQSFQAAGREAERAGGRAAGSGVSRRASIRAMAAATRGSSRRVGRCGADLRFGAVAGGGDERWPRPAAPAPGRGARRSGAASGRRPARRPPAVKRGSGRSRSGRGTTSISGWAAARSSRSSQWTVARWPSSRPARASTQAPASMPPMARKRGAMRRRSRIRGRVATSAWRKPAMTTSASAPSARLRAGRTRAVRSRRSAARAHRRARRRASGSLRPEMAVGGAQRIEHRGDLQDRGLRQHQERRWSAAASRERRSLRFPSCVFRKCKASGCKDA